MTQPALDFDDRSRLASLLEREARDPSRTLPDDVRVAPRFWRRALFEPLGEASRRPGKEFRGRLTEIAWELAGGRGPAPVELAATKRATCPVGIVCAEGCVVIVVLEAWVMSRTSGGDVVVPALLLTVAV